MDFSLFPRDLFAELERLQRQVQQSFEVSPSIRGYASGRFPALNVAATPDSAEIYAFAAGLDPQSIHVQLERGVLSNMPSAILRPRLGTSRSRRRRPPSVGRSR